MCCIDIYTILYKYLMQLLFVYDKSGIGIYFGFQQ